MNRYKITFRMLQENQDRFAIYFTVLLLAILTSFFTMFAATKEFKLLFCGSETVSDNWTSRPYYKGKSPKPTHKWVRVWFKNSSGHSCVGGVLQPRSWSGPDSDEIAIGYYPEFSDSSSRKVYIIGHERYGLLVTFVIALSVGIICLIRMIYLVEQGIKEGAFYRDNQS